MDKNKFPTSKAKKQCIGPCQKPNTWLTHPITFQKGIHRKEPICPIVPIEVEDKIVEFDTCYYVSKNTDVGSPLTPEFILNCSQFLKIHYQIYSFNDIINRLSGNNNFLTNMRIIDCGMKAYGEEYFKSRLVDDILIDFFIKITKKIWMRSSIYDKLKNYVGVDKDRIFFKKKSTETKDSMHIEKTNFIISKFITKDMMNKYLISYIEKVNDKWDSVVDHGSAIMKHITVYIIDQIESIVKN